MAPEPQGRPICLILEIPDASTHAPSLLLRSSRNYGPPGIDRSLKVRVLVRVLFGSYWQHLGNTFRVGSGIVRDQFSDFQNLYLELNSGCLARCDPIQRDAEKPLTLRISSFCDEQDASRSRLGVRIQAVSRRENQQ